MWTVFLANIRLVVASSRTQSARPAALEPLERTMTRLGPPRPLRLHRRRLDFTASVVACTRAAPCLPRAVARTRTCAAACWTSAASPTAAATPSRSPSSRHRTNDTRCTPGWQHQVRSDFILLKPLWHRLGKTVGFLHRSGLQFGYCCEDTGVAQKESLNFYSATNEFWSHKFIRPALLCVQSAQTLPQEVFSALLLLLQPLASSVVVKPSGLLCKSVLLHSAAPV